ARGKEFQFGHDLFMAAGFLKSAFRSHRHHHRTGVDGMDTRPPSLPPFPYPFEPIARSKVYFIVSPTGSGPLIAAVAISGYCMDRMPLTSSTVILLSGSGNLRPRNENSRRIALACMAYLLLLFLFFLLLFFLSRCRARCRL